jgi:hypothetical protein
MQEVDDVLGDVMKTAGLEVKWGLSAADGGPVGPEMTQNLVGMLDEQTGEIKPEAQNNPKFGDGPYGVSVTVPRPVGKHCANCHKINDLRKCAGCREVRYCGVKCQNKHWAKHKKVCKNLPK